jgi:cytochrome P450
MFLKPYLLIQFYEKQGAKSKLMLGKNIVAYHRQNAVKHGDFFHWHLAAIKANPDLNMIAHNYIHGEVLLTLLKADAIRDFSVNQDKYVKSMTALGIYNLMLGDGLLSSDGAKWKRHRKLTAQVMHYEYYQSMIPVILEVGRDVFGKLIKENKLENVHIKNAYYSISAELVGRIFFGDSLSQAKVFDDHNPIEELSELIYLMGMESANLWYFIFGIRLVKAGIIPRQRKLVNKIQRFMEWGRQKVAKRREEFLNNIKNNDAPSQRKDLLELLFASQINDPENSFTDEEILGEFVTFFMAGMDTTGQLLTISTYHLLNNPQYLAEARKDAEDIMSHADYLTTKHVNEETFLSYFLKEALRITPPASGLFPRVALEDHTVGTIKVKKGTLVGIGIKIIGMNTKYYDNPEKFQPERWTVKQRADEAETYSFLPFSTGPRNCIGQHLASMEAKLIFSLFLTTFDVKLAEDYKHGMINRLLYENLTPLRVHLSVKK